MQSVTVGVPDGRQSSGGAESGGQQGRGQDSGQDSGAASRQGFEQRGDSGFGGVSSFAPTQEASFPPEIAMAYDAVLKAPPKPTSFAQRWTAWGASYGGSNTTDGNAAIGSNNLTAQTFGFAGGMDYHWTPDTTVGFAVGAENVLGHAYILKIANGFNTTQWAQGFRAFAKLTAPL